jgi:MFS family permease
VLAEEGRPASDPASELPLITPAFVLITGALLAYFVGIGSLIPSLPHYVEDELGGSGVSVGIAVGAFAVSAALLRPAVGHIGDRRGRRILVLGGALVACVSILGYELASSLPILVVMRLLTGVGEAAIFVGAATAVQDLAPAHRRGEAASYFSVAVYGGLAVGPLLGEYLRRGPGFRSVWFAAAGCCLLAAALGWRMPDIRPPFVESTGRRRLLHPAAIRPGVILALSATGFAGFSAFVPLYVDDIGLDGAGVVFAEYAFAVLVVRVFFARLPDRLGSIRGASLALALQAVGFAVISAWGSPAGLYSGTFVYSMGASLLYPALFPMVVDGAPEAERSQSVATFTLFFDVSQGLGAFVLGIVVTLANERAAFAVAGLMAAVGLGLLRNAQRVANAAEVREPGPAGRTPG